MAKKQKRSKFWTIFLIAIFGLIIIVSIVNIFGEPSLKGNTALIKIEGLIVRTDLDSVFEQTTSSKDIVKQIEKASENKKIKALVFDINSPGGSPVASDEIAQAIKKVNKTTIALVHEVGASGAYWIATSADKIIANRMSIVGSIGVVSSYLEFSGFLDRYGIEYQRLVAGKNKDMGTPFKNLTQTEEQILQEKLDTIHHFFIEEVADNRNLSYDYVKNISTGEFFLGSEALELKLIDQLGNKDTVEKILKKELNLTEIKFASYEKKKSLLKLLFEASTPFSFNIGQGIGYALFKQGTTNKLNILSSLKVT